MLMEKSLSYQAELVLECVTAEGMKRKAAKPQTDDVTPTRIPKSPAAHVVCVSPRPGLFTPRAGG